MTDLFSQPPVPLVIKRDSYTHPRFKVGDKVRPIAKWRDGKTPVIPSGEVKRVDSFGRGQIVKVGSDQRFYVSGIFELDGGDAL